MSIAERFWAKVDTGPGTGCWRWTACVDGDGYGRFSVDGSSMLAHRVAWELVHGPPPEWGSGYVLDHLCRTPHCVNVWSHIEIVTHAENLRRGLINQNAGKTHCIRDHPFDESNTIIRSDGRRGCRTCRNEWVRRSRTHVILTKEV